jgi:hypothetical protein
VVREFSGGISDQLTTIISGTIQRKATGMRIACSQRGTFWPPRPFV